MPITDKTINFSLNLSWQVILLIARGLLQSPDFTLQGKIMKTILIVQFQQTNREILTTAIESDHVAVICTDNGEDALAIIKKQPPDLIITDIMLPKINGFEVCRQLAANPLTVNIPVIIYTSLDEQINAYWARRGCPNVKDFITRTNRNIDHLLEAINRFLI